MGIYYLWDVDTYKKKEVRYKSAEPKKHTIKRNIFMVGTLIGGDNVSMFLNMQWPG